MLVRITLGALLALMVSPWLLAQEATSGKPTPSPDQITLKNGDTLRGTITKNDEGLITIQHPVLGPVTIGLDKIESYGTAPAVDSGSATNRAMEASVGKAPIAELKPWSFYLSLGANGTFSVNDEINLHAAGGVRYETTDFKFNLDGAYDFGAVNNDTSDNNFLANALEEWTLGDTRWIAFGQQQYEYDEFQAWEHRMSAYGGPGYRLIESDTMELTVRAGVGATYQIGDVHELSAEMLLAETFTWQLSKRQKVGVISSIAPKFTDFSSFRVQIGAEWIMALDDSKKGLALTVGARDQYESKPDSGSVANDLRVYAGVRYDF